MSPYCDELTADETRARLLFESGDMGMRPGRRYPVGLGTGEYAQRWHAVMGRSEEEYLRGLEAQVQREYPDRYIRKLRRRPRTATSSPNDRLIGVSQFREVYSAVSFANLHGAILNTHVTVNWSSLGYEEDTKASAALQGGLMKHMRLWFQHKRDQLARPFAWIYAHERGAVAGLHTHLLVFIPYEWRPEFDDWIRTRVARLSRRRPCPKEAVDITDRRKDRQLLHQWMKFGYLMKTVDPQASLPVFPGSATTVPLADLVPWACESPGEVKCKRRVGIAKELRATARIQAEYSSLLDRGVTDVRLLFDDYDFKAWEWAQEEALYAELDEETAKLLTARVLSARGKGDEEFQRRYDAWVRMAKGREERMREAEKWGAARAKLTATHLDALSRLLGGGAMGGAWQAPAW